MEFKFKVLVALMGLILLSCRSYAQENANKASTMAERASFGGHNEAVNRKLLLRGPVLPEEKIGGSSSSSAETKGTHDNQHGLTPSAETTSRVVERDLSSKKAGIGNNHQLKGVNLNHKSTQNEEKSLPANEMEKSLTPVHRPPQMMFGKPNFHVDYSGPQTHGPKHH